jgi:hypothetical protein
MKAGGGWGWEEFRRSRLMGKNNQQSKLIITSCNIKVDICNLIKDM